MGAEPVFRQSGGNVVRKPKSRTDAAVRASVVAKKRVMIVEPRDAGRKRRKTMAEPKEHKQPSVVPNGAKQDGEALRGNWEWVEGSVWTLRMLGALERGVKGNRWFSLNDKVWKEANLQSALEKVVRNGGSAGVDGQRVEQLAERGLEIVAEVKQQLQDRVYRPKPVLRAWIEKLGSKEMRPLGIPTVQDRMVQTALRNVLEPIFEWGFAEHSYGFRPGRGAKQALRRVSELLDTGHVWIVDADLKGYFDSIPQDRLMAAVEEKIADGAVLELIQRFLKQGVMETAKGWQPTETGTPQGAVISPLLANIYLDPLDHMMAGRGWEMVRYADDFVILCRSEAEAQAALEAVKQWTAQAGLTLHPTKTRLVDASQKGGFDFLGYHFERGYQWPRAKSVTKLKETVRAKTRRNNGQSMNQIVEDLNRTLRGWGNYFSQGNHSVHKALDGWIRQRLRAILKQRAKRKGHPKGRDFQRWPIAYFDRLGLYRLSNNLQLRLSIPGRGF